ASPADHDARPEARLERPDFRLQIEDALRALLTLAERRAALVLDLLRQRARPPIGLRLPAKRDGRRIGGAADGDDEERDDELRPRPELLEPCEPPGPRLRLLGRRARVGGAALEALCPLLLA